MVTDLERTAFFLGINYCEYSDAIRAEIDSLSDLHTRLIIGRVSETEARDLLYHSSVDGLYSTCKSLLARFGSNEPAERLKRLEDMKKVFDVRYKQVKEFLEGRI